MRLCTGRWSAGLPPFACFQTLGNLCFQYRDVFAFVRRAMRGIAMARYVLLRKHLPGVPPSLAEEEDDAAGTGEEEHRGGSKALEAGRQRRHTRPSASAAGQVPALDLVALPEWRVMRPVESEAGRSGSRNSSGERQQGRSIGIVLHRCKPGEVEDFEGDVSSTAATSSRRRDDDGEHDFLVAPRM